MIKSVKLVRMLVMSLIVVMLGATTAFAATASFSKKLVDSNSYGDVVTATKGAKGSVATVYISNIYEADGSSSSYTYVMVKVKNGSDEQRAKKGVSCDLALYSDYRAKGKSLTMRAKGNVPWLDCKISGDFNAH